MSKEKKNKLIKFDKEIRKVAETLGSPEFPQGLDGCNQALDWIVARLSENQERFYWLADEKMEDIFLKLANGQYFFHNFEKGSMLILLETAGLLLAPDGGSAYQEYRKEKKEAEAILEDKARKALMRKLSSDFAPFPPAAFCPLGMEETRGDLGYMLQHFSADDIPPSRLNACLRHLKMLAQMADVMLSQQQA